MGANVVTSCLHVCLSRLKKDLKGLLVVHPAWYIKALITVVKPFIRSAGNTKPGSFPGTSC